MTSRAAPVLVCLAKDRERRMSDTNKIVAAILTAAYTSKDASYVDPTDYVRAFQEMLAELENAEKPKKDAIASALSGKVRERRSKA